MKSLGVMLLIFPGTVLLSACSGSATDDLDEWMKTETASFRSHIDPVPAIQPYTPFIYQAFDMVDPFSSSKIQQVKGKGANSPDPNWKKEALEEFELEKLTMVGTLQNKQEGKIALIKAPSGELFKAKTGGHIGRNFGVITSIADDGLELKELVEDSNGDWSERSASLKLVEQERK